MDVMNNPTNRMISGLFGSVISLALVFGGTSGRAEGITGFGAGDAGMIELIGGFSAGDLEQLEHATTAQATSARLAAMGARVPEVQQVKPRPSASDNLGATVEADAEVFRHSGRLMPMLVTRPEAATPAFATAPVTLRPGLVQPVGVPRASLRSPTPSERAAR